MTTQHKLISATIIVRNERTKERVRYTLLHNVTLIERITDKVSFHGTQCEFVDVSNNEQAMTVAKYLRDSLPNIEE